MAHKLRSDSVVKFVGPQCEFIAGARLPTIRQVLAAFYYQLRTEKHPIKTSARNTAKQVFCFWRKTKIPIVQEVYCIEKIEKLHAELSAICKNTSRTNSKAQANREALFCNKLDHIFDVAKKMAIPEMEKNAQREVDPAIKQALLEDIKFLNDQREGTRAGTIAGIDGILAGKAQKKLRTEQRKKDKQKLLEERRKKSEAKSHFVTANSVMLSSSSESSEDTDDEVEQKSRRGTQKVITPVLAQALDAAKVSMNSATVILAAAAKSFGVDVNDTNINRSTIHRERGNERSDLAQKVMENFNPDDFLTVHWDGKVVSSLIGKDQVDRQAIVVTGKSTTQLLGVPFIDRKATGKAIGEAVVELIKKWKLMDRIKAMSFDTTSVNTGWKNGAAAHIERQLETTLLWLPCRHHILELVLESVYHTIMGRTTGPEVTIFKQFQDHWKFVDKEKYVLPSTSDFPPFLSNRLSELASFAENSIHLGQPRDDYLELLELAIIFLGHTPPRGIQFRVPGPVHNARWMAKAIYSLKMFLFQQQFPQHNLSGLFSVCVFIVGVYVEAWFSAPFASSAPRSDLKMIADLKDFESFHAEAGDAAQKKFSGHLWYLSEELIGLSIFDAGLSFEEREMIAKSISVRQGSDDPAKKRSFAELSESLDELVTTNTADFFKVLGIETDFFDQPATEWDLNVEYQKGEAIINHLKVVNDHAERAVKLMQDYNKSITQKESGFQNLLLNVEDFRNKVGNKQKQSLQNFVNS